MKPHTNISAAPVDKPGFDFDAAVAEAQRDYPRMAAHTTFVNLSAPDAREQLQHWFAAISPEHVSPQQAAILLAGGLKKNGFTFIDHAPLRMVMAMRPDSTSGYTGGGNEAPYVFNHELGHAVTGDGYMSTGDAPPPLHVIARGEIAADIFAVLRGISTGTMTREDAENLSMARAMKAPGVHATSFAIDTLLAETSDDKIRAMTPDKIAELARDYAALYAPRPGEIEALARKLQWVQPVAVEHAPMPDKDLAGKLKDLFGRIKGHGPKSAEITQGAVKMRRLGNEEWLENVADLLKTSEPGSLAFHTGAKILTAVFNTGRAGYPQAKEFDVSDAKWDALRRTFTQPRP